jgi:hypothetical protein
MVQEVCFLIGTGGEVLWRDTSGVPYALADSRTRWEMIWWHRAALVEIAHSHPRGPLAFSAEDESTMAAVDAALGRRLCYSVVTPTEVLRRNGSGELEVLGEAPPWAAELRAESGLEG